MKLQKYYAGNIICKNKHRRPAAGRLDLIGPQQADRLAARRLQARLARGGLWLVGPRREGEGVGCRRGCAPVGLPRADRPAAGRQGAATSRGWPAAPCGLILPFLPSSSPLPPFFFCSFLFLPSPLSTQKCNQFIHLNEQVFRDFGTVNGFNSVRAAKRGLDLLMG